jgi:peptidoglycan hydrolase CwlO-like protein
MFIFADMSPSNVAFIAAFTSIVVGGLSSLVTWTNSKKSNEVSESTHLFDAYNDVVNNLQKEVSRLQDSLSAIRQEMKKCDLSNKQLTSEIRYLQSCVDLINADSKHTLTIAPFNDDIV